MANYGPRLVVPIDVKKKPWEQKLPLHNRWHPEIPPVDEVRCGEVFRVEMVDFSGGGITKDYSAEDIKYADPSIVSSLLICLWLWIIHCNHMEGARSSFPIGTIPVFLVSEALQDRNFQHVV